MSNHDVRLQQLQNWLQIQLPQVFAEHGWGDVADAQLTPASSDASFRRYFRWQSDSRSLILMDAPPAQENSQAFVDIAALLASAGLHVPTVLAADLQQGFLILDDLGRQTYLDVIDSANADALFSDAIEALIEQQRLPHDQPLPHYDYALLNRELQLFPDWYVQQHLGVSFTEQQQAAWQGVCEQLINSALAQPKVLVHRDFMPRNLMISTPNPGVLDFQDAVYGPVTYDITCLFKDAFISWPAERVRAWQQQYWQQARAAGIAVQDDFDEFLRASDLMGVQRHLKVIGIFARICHRDGKPRYLSDVPRFFAYIREVLARRPELAALAELFEQLPLPAEARA